MAEKKTRPQARPSKEKDPTLEGAFEAAFRAGIARWFWFQDPSFLLQVAGLALDCKSSPLIPAYGLRDLRKLIHDDPGIRLEGADLKLQAAGKKDEAETLRRLARETLEVQALEAKRQVHELALALERYQAEDLGKILGQITAKAAQGLYQGPAELLGEVGDLAQVHGSGITVADPFQLMRSPHELRVENPPGELVQGFLYDQSFAILAGDPKSRKTTLLLQAGLAIVSGRDLFALPVLKRGPVVVVEADMGEDRFVARLRQIIRGMGIGEKEKLEHEFFFFCSTAIDLGEPGQRARLMQQIASKKPALVILDPLRDLHQGDENDARELKPILDVGVRLRDMTGGCVVMVDHLNKPARGERGKPSQNPAGYLTRGSGSKYARADSTYQVKDCGGGVSSVESGHRYGPETPPWFFRLEEIDDGEGVRLVECQKPEKSSDPEKNGVRPNPEASQQIQEYLSQGFGEGFSMREMSRDLKLRRQTIAHEIGVLYARELVGHNNAHPRQRRWHWIGPESVEDLQESTEELGTLEERESGEEG